MNKIIKFLGFIMIFTLLLYSLAGCSSESDNVSSNISSTLYEQNIPHDNTSNINTFSDEELKLAQEQLPMLIDILLASSFNTEDIPDASRMSMENIWRFVISATSKSYNKQNNPYREDLYQEKYRTITVSSNGTENKQDGPFIPMKNAKQIAYEFFGVDYFYYSGYYDVDWDGYVIPAVGLPYDYKPKNLEINFEPNGNIEAELTLLPGRGPEQEYGRYSLNFPLLRENGHTFIRFLKSEKISENSN